MPGPMSFWGCPRDLPPEMLHSLTVQATCTSTPGAQQAGLSVSISIAPVFCFQRRAELHETLKVNPVLGARRGLDELL